MQTALDANPSTFNAYERRLVDGVRSHGWFGVSVAGDGEQPGFTYSVGFWRTLGRPEIIISGLPGQLSHDVLWALYRRFEGAPDAAIPDRLDDLLSNVSVILAPAGEAARDDYLLSANWFYGGEDYPCLQLIWPDLNGVFPWEEGVDPDCLAGQDDLSVAGWEPPKPL